MKIGGISIASPCILAPMAGITDLPFRLVNRTLGCRFAFAEMISARALVFQSAKTERMLSTSPDDRPLGIQLLGDDPEVILRAMERLRKYRFEILDLNAACPVAKVTRRGEGAALMLEPKRLRDLLMVMVAHSEVPVTVKIRSGWDEKTRNAREVALNARDAGIKALFIHGRTKLQGYRGRVDYEVIRDVKEALDVPVIASGDTLSPLLVRKMFDETGCDGVTIARGALGNPWIFRETAEFLEKGSLPEKPGIEEIIAVMSGHLDLCCRFHGEKNGTMIFRKFFAWYTKGIRDMKTLKDLAFRAKTKDEMKKVIEELRFRESGSRTLSDSPQGRRGEDRLH